MNTGIDSALSTIIVQDNLHSLRQIRKYIATRPEFKSEDTARSGHDALEKLKSKHYDLLFIDIHLPGISGFDVLEMSGNTGYVVFVTAYDKYAVKAFEIGAVDYLLKPFTRDRFNNALDRFLERLRIKSAPIAPGKVLGLMFRSKREQFFFAYQDVRYFSSKRKHSIVHTIHGHYEIPETIKSVEKRLPVNMFMRVHKQYLINMVHISRLKSYGKKNFEVYLGGGLSTPIPVGRKYIVALRKRLGILFKSPEHIGDGY